jgi:hypothetical protein
VDDKEGGEAAEAECLAAEKHPDAGAQVAIIRLKWPPRFLSSRLSLPATNPPRPRGSFTRTPRLCPAALLLSLTSESGYRCPSAARRAPSTAVSVSPYNNYRSLEKHTKKISNASLQKYDDDA